MFRDVLQSIDGVATYPVIALILFVAAFVGVLIWVWSLDRGTVERWSRLPLEGMQVPAEGGTSENHDGLASEGDR